MLDATAHTPKLNRLATAAAGIGPAAAASWLLCRAGTALCALPLEQVVEIMRVLPVEQIAGAPHYVRGLSVIRGVPVPVVDVGRIISNETVAVPTRFATIRTEGRTLALAIEAVLGIVAIEPGVLGRLPPLLQDAATDVVASIGARDRELLVFFHSGRLIPEDVFDRLHDGAPS